MSRNYDVAFRLVNNTEWTATLEAWGPDPGGRGNGVMLMLRAGDRVAFMQNANVPYYYCTRHHGIEGGFSVKILEDTPVNISEIMPSTLPANYATITPWSPKQGVTVRRIIFKPVVEKGRTKISAGQFINSLMSLTDLTRNAFQSGLSPAKWVSLCQMFLWRGNAPHTPGLEAEISSSVLMLFEYYPGDAVLQAYLKEAIQSRLISLPTFTATFLLAARSRALREPVTLSLLCKTIQEAHVWLDPSAAPATLLPEDPDLALGTIRDALELLKTVTTYDPLLPTHHFQRVVAPVGDLIMLLTNPTPNFPNASWALALECIQTIKDLLLHAFSLDHNLRQPLENLAFSLNLFLGENAGLNPRGTVSSARSSLGQVDILGPGLETDITTCSLLLFHLIVDRAKAYGSGHDGHATALLVATFRATTWSLPRFFIQLFQSAVTCLSTDMSHVTGKRPISLWNAFLASRLPRLLVSCGQVLAMDKVLATEYRAALREAWGTLALGDPHTSSLAHYENMWSLVDSQSFENTDKPVSFTRAFTYQLFSLGLLDQTFAVRIDPSLSSASPSRLQTEAREAGVDFGHYLNQKFSSDLNANDTQTLLQRIYSDPISHATFAEMVLKRFHTASSSLDVETLGHISRILSTNDAALDLVSLHVELSTLVSSALAFVEEYDIEAVGDPQSAVANLGAVVLFAQLAITRFKISDTLKHKNRPLDINYLRRADAIPMLSAPTPEAKAFKAWFKALFDKNSEGIEDGVFRSTRPKTLLAIAATVFLHAIRAAAERKLELDTLNNGIAYFLGPLLGWTLPGIVLALVRQIRLTRFQSTQHLIVLRTIMKSPNLPRPVLTLCGPSVMRLLSEWRGGTQSFDVPALRQEVIKATGIPVSEPILNSPSPSWADQSRRAVQDALVLLQSGKPPFLNVAACLVETPAFEFLQTLWLALDMPIKTDATADAAKRLAVFVLATPRASPTPPLLPIFLHNLLPSLIDKFDNPNLGQAMTGDLELLIAIVSSSLMAALQLERALYTASGEHVFVLGSSSSAMASRLALGLRHRKSSSKGKLIAQRLTSSQTFVANFPVFKTEI